MIKRDYHGFRLQEALDDIHSIVGAVRRKRSEEDVELITGHGIIRDKVMELLRSYSLSPSIQIGNSGVVKCLVY